MNIKIEEDVREYLKKKGQAQFYLDIKITGGGCCDTFELAEVNLGVPENKALYYQEEIDGLTVYISKKAKVLSTLVFTTQKTLFMTSIEVKGLSLITKS